MEDIILTTNELLGWFFTKYSKIVKIQIKNEAYDDLIIKPTNDPKT